MAGIILVGTMHLDLDGPRRLETLLAQLQPERITIEWPSLVPLKHIEQGILESRQQKMSVVRSLQDIHLNARKLIEEFLALEGYDTLIPIKYAKHHKVSIIPVDHQKVLPLTKPDEPGFRQNLLAGLGNPSYELDQRPYAKVRQDSIPIFDRAYTDPKIFQEIGAYMDQQGVCIDDVFLQQLTDTTFEEVREQWMTDRIREAQPDVHIGGIAHMVKGYFSPGFSPLYQRLGDVVKQVIRLGEVTPP